MTKTTVYPHTVSQSSGGSIQSFNNLGNVKNTKDTYAKTNQIASKSGTRKTPAAITAKNFKANIPTGSKINSVTVEYAADYEGNITIGKPTINILNITGDNKSGKALTKTMTKTSVTWNGNHTIANMNSSDFGVKISFPANTKADVGYVKVKYIRIIIDYTAPNYRVTANKIAGVYTNDEFKIKVNAINVNNTPGTSNVTIQLPSGVSYKSKDSGDGSVTVSGSKLTWKPGLSDKKVNASIILKLNITTNGNHNIIFNEAATDHIASLNISTSEKPAPVIPTQDTPDVPDDTPEPIIVKDEEALPHAEPTPTNVVQVRINEEFYLDLTFDNYSGNKVRLYAYAHDYTFDSDNAERTDKIQIYRARLGALTPGWYPLNSYDNYNHMWPTPAAQSFENSIFENLFRIVNNGHYTILIYSEDNETLLKQVLISVKPDTLTVPVMSILKLTQEELDRLGDRIVYTVQSFMKLITNEPFVRDWGKNFRIGVFNNINPNIDTTTEITETVVEDGDEITVEPIETEIVDDTDYENLTNQQIYDYAEYWSDPLDVINEYSDVKCDFVYNQKYPVYLIITGDHAEGNPLYNTIQFTEPCVIESRVYNGHEPNGNFPFPILNLIDNLEPSEQNLKLFEKGNSVVIYQFPLGENFGVTDNLAITGIELTGEIVFADQVTLSAKLFKSDKTFGERSILINDPDNDEQENSFSIGGPYDLWGFRTLDIENLEKWWIELEFYNIYDNQNDLAELQLKNLQIIVYMNNFESQLVTVKVEDENVAHYGFFLDEVDIPEGLMTETKFLAIDGTDTNDAYRMNVISKIITLKFQVRGCTIDETTHLLRQLAKLFVNDRDELNRPIPKKIEFSHYPDVYFEYIMEDAFDTDVESATYDSTVKLTIPSGTSFSKKETISNHVGVNHGLTKVKPVITFIPTGDLVEITEVKTNQKFKITCKDWSVGNTVEIDCINRNITILDYLDSEENLFEKDITCDGDINNDWFVIHKEYDFQIDNGIIKTVKFTERW